MVGAKRPGWAGTTSVATASTGGVASTGGMASTGGSAPGTMAASSAAVVLPASPSPCDDCEMSVTSGHTKLIEQEGQHIRLLADAFIERTADAVPGIGAGAQEDRQAGACRRLRSRSELSRLQGIDPAIRGACQHQHRRVWRTRDNMM